MQKTISVINLGAIERNLKYMKRLACGRRFYAVVKADAYGHGAEAVSRHIEPFADGFCVAITEEGAALRIAGITKPVLVLTPLTCAEDAVFARFYGLEVTVNGVRSARLAAGLRCHIKVNTGMNRYGCNPDELVEVLRAAEGSEVAGVYSHLYLADSQSASRRQLELFRNAAGLVKDRFPSACAHLAASGGIFLGGEYLFDGVRCGIAMYGYAPSGFVGSGLEPALKVYARRVQTGIFTGGGAGYARAAKNYGKLSAYRLGYADGFARTVPLGEGNLCMDAFVSEAEEDVKLVFDDAESYAKLCGTISYEALCSVTRRSEKIYFV